MHRKLTDAMLNFIQNNPTAFHVIASLKSILNDEGYQELLECNSWILQAGGKYYVSRNGSSLIAFQVGTELRSYSFNIAVSHSDSPTFKVKESAEINVSDMYIKLNVEGYGNMICSTWLDRPLSIAGRVWLRKGDGKISPVLVNLDRDLVLIPSVAIHLNRSVNDGYSFNKQTDMLPLFAGDEQGTLIKLIAKELGITDEEQILGSDLFLYNRDKPSVWGCNGEFISSGRLDNQQCAFAVLQGFLGAANSRTVNVMACFDNEEVGSHTRQGAASTFLHDVLKRINLALGKSEEDYLRVLAASFMLSADNAHAVHPNHPEYTDSGNNAYLNNGVVIKSHAGQKYTSDGTGIAVVRELAERRHIPLQHFINRSDIMSGGTLGNIAMANVSVQCVDIGLPQLAMHSCYETAGMKDTWYMAQLLSEFYGSRFDELVGY